MAGPTGALVANASVTAVEFAKGISAQQFSFGYFQRKCIFGAFQGGDFAD
jgi:hypothetical protein